MAGGALGARLAGHGRGPGAGDARALDGTSIQLQKLERGTGFGSVRGAGGQRGAGLAGPAGRDAGGNGHLWHGVVCGE